MTDLQFAPAMVTARKTTDGGLVIESPVPLGGYETQVGQMLRRWAGLTPHNPFLAERNRDGQWVRLCYSEAAERADRISQALLDRELSLERPVMVLSGNSIEHALLSLGAMRVGIPVVPVSPAYALLRTAGDHPGAMMQPTFKSNLYQ